MPAPTLTAPFSWKDPAFQPLLERLQGNILKGHGRHHTMNFFFQVVSGKKDEARAALKLVATAYVGSALKQLNETEDFKEARAKEETFISEPLVSILLTKVGYENLGITDTALIPADTKFRAGLRGSNADLSDPVVADWDEGYRAEADGMVLIAAESPERVDEQLERILAITEAALLVTQFQRGKAIFNARGEGLEHFGYVDGRSQPLFLQEDIAEERKNAGTSQWNPAFPPDRVLVADPAAFLKPNKPNQPGEILVADEQAFGSYFIFRKLEERVRAFKRMEQELADKLGFSGERRELAEALCVGRFEDGTPVTLSDEPLDPTKGDVPNDFNYDHDTLAGKCPFHAHIRKTNPRGSGTGDAAERQTIMARRGITYEDIPREVEPKDLPGVESFAEFREKVETLLPEGDLGLLFMAYNADIGTQFEVTQRFWANSTTFPPLPSGTDVVNPGRDPVIGQPFNEPPPQQWPTDWVTGKPPALRDFSFRSHVIMKGGDYFFAPSLPFLRGL